MSASEQNSEKIEMASQWKLVWRRFRRHHLATSSGLLIIGLYFIAVFAEFLATGDPQKSNPEFSYLPPQAVYWFDNGRFAPHVYGLAIRRDPLTFQRVYRLIPDQKIPVKFFGEGFEYKLLGLFRTKCHLLAAGENNYRRTNLFLLGTDKLGRDMWSRLLFGTRISMSIGLIGVGLSFVLGVILGGLSGFYGGLVDTVIQRIIELIRSIPTIPLWMGLAAALPKDWSVLQVYFAITIIISFIAWTEMARVIRGRFLVLRNEDFVMAARLAGCSELRIILRHIIPSCASHIVAATTLAVPRMIISETALSFLGLGLRPPAVSWGVMLQQAQNIQAIALFPWLMAPALLVAVAVLAFNFLGDGLRDAADPYTN